MKKLVSRLLKTTKFVKKTVENFFTCYKTIPTKRYANETIRNRLKTRSRNVNSPTSNQPCRLPFFFREFSSGKSFLLFFSRFKMLKLAENKTASFRIQDGVKRFFVSPHPRYRFNLLNVELSLNIRRIKTIKSFRKVLFLREKKQIIFALKTMPSFCKLTTILKPPTR